MTTHIRRVFGPRRRAGGVFLVMPGLMLLLLLMQWCLAPLSVTAHPLGNFTVNHYSRIEVSPERVQVVYILDMAEIPTFQELSTLPTDITKDAAGRAHYAATQAERIRKQLRLTFDGAPVALATDAVDLSFPPGQADLPTLRLTAHYLATTASSPRTRAAEYRDDTYAERQGWKEIVVRALPGISLISTTAPTEDATDELRNYPQDLLQSPLNLSSAQFRFAPGAGGVTYAAPAVPALGKSGGDSGFAALISGDLSAFPVVLFALCAAVVFGAGHALTPGHGKTLVGAYLVGARGTTRQAIALGATVTITHTASVFALGFITLFASRFILPEKLYPILGAASGLFVVALGGALLWHRLREARHRWRTPYGRGGRRPSAEAGGVMPNGYAHEHEDGVTHAHGPFGAHSHTSLTSLSMGPADAPVSWRNLLALGISGGILPCPSALVVMLSAIALHRVGFGIALIFAFSIGLAAVLTGIGLLFVHGGKLMGRLPFNGRLALALPVLSALGVTVLGIAMTAKALIPGGGGG